VRAGDAEAVTRLEQDLLALDARRTGVGCNAGEGEDDEHIEERPHFA
jgi:hypothetical protein